MDKRIEIFLGDEGSELSQHVNGFLQRTNGKLHDVKCSLAHAHYDYDEDLYVPILAVCLVYTPETNEE